MGKISSCRERVRVKRGSESIAWRRHASKENYVDQAGGIQISGSARDSRVDETGDGLETEISKRAFNSNPF